MFFPKLILFIILGLITSPFLVRAFVFPQDWRIIQKSMKDRWDKELKLRKWNLTLYDTDFSLQEWNETFVKSVYNESNYDDYEEGDYEGELDGVRGGFEIPTDQFSSDEISEETTAKETGVIFGSSSEEEEEEEETITTIDPILESIMSEFENTSQNMDNSLRFHFDKKIYNISETIWKLTMNLTTIGNDDANILFSPVSVASLVNLLILGCANGTRDSLINLMDYDSLNSLEEIHETWMKVLWSTRKDLGVTFDINNVIFHLRKLDLNSNFAESIQEFYRADIIPLNFDSRPRSSLKRMNYFMNKRTRGLIPKLYSNPMDRDTKLIAVNTVYFKGYWEYPFPVEPWTSKFRMNTNESFELPYLVADMDVPYHKEESYEIFSIPYKNELNKEGDPPRTSLFIILPSMEYNLTHVLRNEFKDLIQLDAIFHDMDSIYATVQIPKMYISSKMDLSQYFLDDPGDFSPMVKNTTTEIPLNQIQHESVLKLSEKGTEASAFTNAFHFRLGTYKVLDVNRPFALFIWDAHNKLVLFWATIYKPEPLNE